MILGWVLAGEFVRSATAVAAPPAASDSRQPATTVGAVGEADGDGDGVVDAADRCPRQVGLAVDGCPPRDGDGDGVIDAIDGCPADPGPRATHGCPDQDRDGDGVVDRIDRCPDAPGAPAYDGCLAVDADADGVPDAFDRCPSSAETFNGRADGDGCVDRGGALFVAVKNGQRLRARLSLEGRLPTQAQWHAYLTVALGFGRQHGVARLSILIVPPHSTSLGAALDLAAAWAKSLEAAIAKSPGRYPSVVVHTAFPGTEPGLFIGRAQ